MTDIAVTERPPLLRTGEVAARLPGHSLSSLDEAGRDPDGAVLLTRAGRAMLFAAAPAAQVQCDAGALHHLAADLDLLVWPALPPAGGVSFEQWAIGSRVPGDLGGGRITPGIWVHPRLVDMGLEPRIRAVISGRSSGLIRPGEPVYAAARIDEDHLPRAALNRLCRDAFPHPLPIEVVRLADSFEAAQVQVDRLNATRGQREADRPKPGKGERRIYYMTWGPLALPTTPQCV